jgi:colanic acid/amylovoran biosynthesis glycosyltransferase
MQDNSVGSRDAPGHDGPGREGSRAGKPLVALLTSRFLPLSQTFIAAQLAHYERYEPEVLARRREHADRFADPRVFTLTPGGPLRHLEVVTQNTVGFCPSFLARLRERGHRLLHAQFGREGLLALPLQAALGLPLLVTFRGRDVSRVAGRPGWPHPWLEPRRRRLFRTASRILAVSQDLARQVVTLGAPPERVRVWHVGIRIPPMAARPERPGQPLRVIMAGRFFEKKGFEYGIEAFAGLVHGGRDVTLAILGEGSRQAGYRRLAAGLGVSDRVEMPGMLPHDALLDRIAAADVVMVPSVTARNGDREGIPNVLKEASARGVAVVATRHGGIPEAVDHGRTGLLVPERDARALHDALQALASDPGLRRRLGDAGREKMAREFDVRRQVAELEELYDRVLEESGR